jgi:acyl-CoA hydrolase
MLQNNVQMNLQPQSERSVSMLNCVSANINSNHVGVVGGGPVMAFRDEVTYIASEGTEYHIITKNRSSKSSFTRTREHRT